MITSALANAYCELYPESGLTPYDAKLISMASGFAEVGQLALPDDIIWGGAEQPEPERSLFYQHTKLGRMLCSFSYRSAKSLHIIAVCTSWADRGISSRDSAVGKPEPS